MRCLRIIYPQLSYSDALSVSGLQLLSVRREASVIKLFNEIKNPNHVLHYLLPVKPIKLGSITRNTYPYELKFGSTNRRSHSLIFCCIGKRCLYNLYVPNEFNLDVMRIIVVFHYHIIFLSFA